MAGEMHVGELPMYKIMLIVWQQIRHKLLKQDFLNKTVAVG